MMKRIIFLAALSLSGASRADTTATYAKAAANFTMTVKIAANGDIRGEMPGRTYYFVDGQDYFADRTSTGVFVARVDDLAKVMAEKVAELSGNMGLPSSSPPSLLLVRKGKVSINKWSGDAYYMQAPSGQVSPEPITVVSNDPSLAELGKAMERQFAKSEEMMRQVSKGHAPTSNMAEILKLGAPIAFAGADLQSVSHDPIPKDAFVLPAPPAPIDEIRKKMIQH